MENGVRRKHIIPERAKALAASALAQKVGYLRVEDFPPSNILARVPEREYKPRRVIRCGGLLCLVSRGSVQIRHPRHDYLVKRLTAGALFGEMPLLGQTMLGTEAVAGHEGAVVSIINLEAAREWVRSNPTAIFKRIGSRLVCVEAEHYRSEFQLADSRIAAFLLKHSGASSVVKGWSHEKIGEELGLYRETVTIILDQMKHDRLIEVNRMEITIRDKRAMRELSEM